MNRIISYSFFGCAAALLLAMSMPSLYAQVTRRPRPTPLPVPTAPSRVQPPATDPNYRTTYIPRDPA